MSDQDRWTMHGLPRGDQRALKTWEEAEGLIEELGFLPLFQNEIPGFSLEERTLSESWFTGEKDDPWEWRINLARHGRVAYGKLFAGKAGFVSKDWYPAFANYRRDGYDFDARWDDELASIRSKKIMDLFMEETSRELFSNQIKEMGGFKKEGTGFENEMTKLTMQGYLVIKDFQQRINKEGKPYGWSISLYCTPEHQWGEEFITGGYQQSPEDSFASIINHLLKKFPEANPANLKRILLAPGKSEGASRKKALPYPANLIKAMKVKGLSYETMTPDQRVGWQVAMGQLQLKHQTFLWQKYHDSLKNDEIAKLAGKAAGTIGTHHSKAMSRLRMYDLSTWYLDGYNENIKAYLKVRNIPFLHPFDPSLGLTMEDYCLAIGLHLSFFQSFLLQGVLTISDLKKYIESDPDHWYKPIMGLGWVKSRDVLEKLERAMEKMAK